MAATFFDIEFQSFGTTGLLITAAGLVIGGAAGFTGARVVKMTAMPQMVALFNGAGGGAAALVSILEVARTASPTGAGALGIGSGALEAVPQPADGVSMAPKITVEDAQVRWAEPAFAVDRRIRACSPAPGAWSTFRGERVKLGPVTPAGGGTGLRPGEISVGRSGVLVGTGTGAVALGEVRAAGKKPMPGDAWARGVRPEPAELFQ